MWPPVADDFTRLEALQPGVLRAKDFSLSPPLMGAARGASARCLLKEVSHVEKDCCRAIGAFRARGSGGRPTCGSVRPLREAIERAGREIVAKQPEEGRSRGRFWTGIALIAGGGVLAHSAMSSLAMTRPDRTTARMSTALTTEKIRTAGTRQCSAEESPRPPLEVSCCLPEERNQGRSSRRSGADSPSARLSVSRPRPTLGHGRHGPRITRITRATQISCTRRYSSPS